VKAKRIAALDIEAADPDCARAALLESLGLVGKSPTGLKVGDTLISFTRARSQPATTEVTSLTIEVEDLEQVKRRLAALDAQAEEGEELSGRRFVIVPPGLTHGVTLKLRQA